MDKKPATAKVLTDEEKWEIRVKGKYILTAMDDIGKNGDAYCTDGKKLRVLVILMVKLTILENWQAQSLLLCSSSRMNMELRLKM